MPDSPSPAARMPCAILKAAPGSAGLLDTLGGPAGVGSSARSTWGRHFTTQAHRLLRAQKATILGVGAALGSPVMRAGTGVHRLTLQARRQSSV